MTSEYDYDADATRAYVRTAVNEAVAAALAPYQGLLSAGPLAPGYYNLPGKGGSVAGLMSFNGLCVGAFAVTKTIVIDQLNVVVSTPGSAGVTMRYGIYADGGSIYPTTLLYESAPLPADVAATVPANLSLTLTPGLYWLGLVQQGTGTAATVSIVNTAVSTPPIAVPYTALVTSSHTGYNAGGITGALPSPYPAGRTPPSNTPQFTVRVASVA